MKNNNIKVVELFAGVGGFRVGLERASKRFETIWANQWEPGSKVQHAFDVYSSHFKTSENVNESISDVWKNVPEHDLLVGGFPCQDYSVAQGNRAKGINGKKGVLWWDIHRIVELRKPKMILLENVDRLLNSPTKQRGRDFAIMIRSLNDLGYAVEWKAITASEYGFVQKRRRVFIYAYKTNEVITPSIEYIENNSLLNKAFPNEEFLLYKHDDISSKMYKTLVDVTDKYGDGKFLSTGIAVKGIVFSAKYKPKYNGKHTVFKEIFDKKRSTYHYLNDEQMAKAQYTKSHKKIPREKNGFKYNYSEGQMAFPEDTNKPGRTMLTSEGSINRSTHFIKAGKKVRFMTPVEAERMNGFPDDWTKGKTERQRFFFMGNALVTGVVEKIGREIHEINK